MKRIITTYLFSLAVVGLFANDPVVTKTIVKEWNVNANTHVHLDVDYQDIKIVFWNENKIKYSVDILSNDEHVTQTALEEKVDISSKTVNGELFIYVNFNNNESYVRKIFSGNQLNVSLDGEIYLPNSLSQLSLISKYCDVEAGIIPVKLNLSASYGDLNIVEVQKEVIITSNYADISIKKSNDVKINANYGEFHINESKSMTISSNYSDYSLGSIETVPKLSGNYCDIVISNLGEGTFTTTYSDMEIGTLVKNLSLNGTYSELVVKNISPTFTGISCKGTYADFSFNINESNPIRIDISGNNCSADYEAVPISVTMESEEHGFYSLKAKTKSATSTSPLIQVSANYGDVIFK